MAFDRSTLRSALAIAATAGVLVLTACAPLPAGAVKDFPGWPPVEMPGEGGSGTMPDGSVHALWIEEGQMLAVVTEGSSSCPLVGERIDVVKPAGEGNVVRIVLKEIPADAACTRDLVPHTTEFYTPEAVTTTEPLLVEVGEQSVTVPVK